MKYAYTVQYIEEMYAHYCNLLFNRKDADESLKNYCRERIEFYIEQHELFYSFHWIAAQLPLTQINPKP